MNTQELEELLQELLQAVEQVMQSGEVLSDEFQGQIAQTLNNLVTRIDESRGKTENVSTDQGSPLSASQLSHTPSNDAQLLWILAGQQEQAFISYLRNFPTEATQSLLNNPELLGQTIDQLSQMMPQGQPATIHGIDQADLNSSNIWGTAYDPRSGKMRVRFQGGSEYEYDGVPANIYRAFTKGNASAKTKGKNRYGQWWVGKNPSLGAAMNQYIKAGKFNYRKIK